MDLEELENDPTSSVWAEPFQYVRGRIEPNEKHFDDESDVCRHVFWMVDDEGISKQMVWTEDGRIVPIDDGWGD